jgi:hypothetical protein
MEGYYLISIVFFIASMICGYSKNKEVGLIGTCLALFSGVILGCILQFNGQGLF